MNKMIQNKQKEGRRMALSLGDKKGIYSIRVFLFLLIR